MSARSARAFAEDTSNDVTQSAIMSARSERGREERCRFIGSEKESDLLPRNNAHPCRHDPAERWWQGRRVMVRHHRARKQQGLQPLRNFLPGGASEAPCSAAQVPSRIYNQRGESPRPRQEHEVSGKSRRLRRSVSQLLSLHMKTLTITQARKNLGQLCNEAGRGKMVGIISGHQIFQLKPVQVVAWDDTYVAKEYGVTPDEMDKFVAHADGELAQKEKRGAYTRFKGKFDPKALT